jgi:hypothetical protein
LKERDLQENKTTFDDAIKKCCPQYFLFLDNMKDRASTRPLATSYDGNWKEFSKKEDEEHEQAIDDHFYQNKEDLGATTSIPVSAYLLLTSLLLMPSQKRLPTIYILQDLV